jgi:hypothetical protein
MYKEKQRSTPTPRRPPKKLKTGMIMDDKSAPPEQGEHTSPFEKKFWAQAAQPLPTYPTPQAEVEESEPPKAWELLFSLFGGEGRGVEKYPGHRILASGSGQGTRVSGWDSRKGDQ